MKDYSKFVKVIRTSWVKNWTIDFLQELERQTNKDDITAYCISKKAEFENIIKENSKSPIESAWMNSAATNMSQIRSAIKLWQNSIKLTENNTYPQQTKEGIINQHLSLLTMNYTSNFHKERQEPTNEKKAEQRNNLESITRLDEYIEVIEKMLASLDFKTLAVGLIAATGRRPSEILVTAQFIQKGKYEIEFAGQIKNKGEERQAYNTYTLVDSAIVCDSLARLRRMPEIKNLKKKTLAEVDSAKNSGLNREVVENFKDLINPPKGENELSAKNLRASYAAIAIYLFCPWSKSTNKFITEKLGHVGDATATNYEDYQVCDSKGKPQTRGAWVDKLNDAYAKSKEGNIIKKTMRLSEAASEIINDDEFLPYADQASRISELIRLAKIGKAFEDGEIVNQVVVGNKHTKESQSNKKELSDMSNEELFGSNAPHTGIEKIRRVVDAIKIFNSFQPDSKSRWAINTSVLKELSGCRTSVIDKYLKSTEGRLNVADYNLANEFGYQHNKGKGNVSDHIKL